jgi:hypothetical protein
MEPIDIWRSAQTMVKVHGALAPEKCRRRSSADAELGNADGASAWEAIAHAAQQLLDNGPPDNANLD